MSVCLHHDWRYSILLSAAPPQLDGVNLQGFTNQEVLEVMKQTGQTVTLTVVRKIASVKHVPSEKSLDRGK